MSKVTWMEAESEGEEVDPSVVYQLARVCQRRLHSGEHTKQKTCALQAQTVDQTSVTERLTKGDQPAPPESRASQVKKECHVSRTEFNQ